MNRIKHFLFLFVIGATVFLSSCGGEDEVVVPAPTITVTDQDGGVASSVSAGETVVLNAVASASADIATVKVYVDGTEEASSPGPAGVREFQVPAFSYTAKDADKGFNVNISFVVTDVNGGSGEVGYTLSVIAETPMAYDSVGAILGNQFGKAQSAWNLVDNVREGKDGTTSDMQNPSDETTPWVKGWVGENGTMFVKAASTFDYDNATVESATATYADGTAVSEVSNVAVDDIYIAKLRGKDAYAVIKVTKVDEDIEGANTEEIHFSYKKETADSGK